MDDDEEWMMKLLKKLKAQGGEGSGGETAIKNLIEALANCGMAGGAKVGSLGGGWQARMRRIVQDEAALERLANYWLWDIIDGDWVGV